MLDKLVKKIDNVNTTYKGFKQHDRQYISAVSVYIILP